MLVVFAVIGLIQAPQRPSPFSEPTWQPFLGAFVLGGVMSVLFRVLPPFVLLGNRRIWRRRFWLYTMDSADQVAIATVVASGSFGFGLLIASLIGRLQFLTSVVVLTLSAGALIGTLLIRRLFLRPVD